MHGLPGSTFFFVWIVILNVKLSPFVFYFNKNQVIKNYIAIEKKYIYLARKVYTTELPKQKI